MLRICLNCNTVFGGMTQCPYCGFDGTPLESDYAQQERMKGSCSWCGGKLVDITVGPRRVVCDTCGREDE